jgi:hypothetical protein
MNDSSKTTSKVIRKGAVLRTECGCEKRITTLELSHRMPVDILIPRLGSSYDVSSNGPPIDPNGPPTLGRRFVYSHVESFDGERLPVFVESDKVKSTNTLELENIQGCPTAQVKIDRVNGNIEIVTKQCRHNFNNFEVANQMFEVLRHEFAVENNTITIGWPT